MSQKGKSPKSPAFDFALKDAKKEISKLEDIDLNQLATTSVPVQKRINALKNEQLKMLELEAKFYEELHELECKYAKLYEPFFQKRRTIVTGEYEPNEQEAKWTLDEEEKENGEEEKKAEPIDESKLYESGKELLKNLKAQFKSLEDKKGIPNFWLETLQSFRITAELIQEHDEPILAFLHDIRVNLFDQKPYGYRLEFEFAENPYFTNKVLTKTYELKTDIDPKDPFSFEGPDLGKSTGCKIEWKTGKNVTIKSVKKKIKPRNKKGVPKVITKEEKQDSFFNFFETPKKASDEKAVALKSDEEELSDEEEDEELYMIADFEIGQYIREKIVPKAVLYYTGELDDMDEDDYEYDDEDDEDVDDEDDEDVDDEDEDDDDDDDDEDDEDDNKGKKGKSGKKNTGKSKAKSGKGPEPTPAECKQN